MKSLYHKRASISMVDVLRILAIMAVICFVVLPIIWMASTALKAKIEMFKTESRKRLPKVLKDEIIKEIEGGRSPVKGQGRFDKSVRSYRDRNMVDARGSNRNSPRAQSFCRVRGH